MDLPIQLDPLTGGISLAAQINPSVASFMSRLSSILIKKRVLADSSAVRLNKISSTSGSV